MAINEDIVSQLIESNLPELAKDLQNERKRAVIADVQRLQAIYNRLNDSKLLVERSMSSRSSLSNVLQETSYLGFSKGVTGVSGDLLREIGTLVFEAYEKTSQTLQNLGFIDPVSYTVTYQTSTGGNFMRLGNVDLQPTDLDFEIHRGNLVIRMRETAIKAKLQAKMDDNSSLLSQHYAQFTEPFFRAESKSNNGWKVNRGVASEAFERHWENKGHNLENPAGINSSDLGSEGERWLLYLQSSGNDAYYTGPDTLYAQVKNANASVISNANTVLATLKSILKMVSEEIDDVNATTILERYKKAFTAKSQDRVNINRKLWNSIDQETQNAIQGLFAEQLGKSNMTITSKKVTFT